MNILFITYNTIQTVSCRCRAYFPAKAIRHQNTETRVKLIYFTSRADIDWADIVIFQRIPQAVWYLKKLHLPSGGMLSWIRDLFDYARSKKPTGIDMDDYIFLKGSEIETGVPDDFLPGLLQKSHFVIASTEALRLQLSVHNQNVSVIKNALDFELFEKPNVRFHTRQVLDKIKSWKERGFFILGWTAGKTHGQDFKILHKIIERFDDSLLKRVKIVLIGSQNQEMTAFPDLVYQTRFLPWHQPWLIVKELDANLVLLEDNLLNQCKSELKLIEAGFFGVPSICSPVGVFAEIIYKNEIGLLAATADEWTEKIKQLIRDEGFRNKLGQNARQFVLGGYNLKQRGKEYLGLFKSMGGTRLSAKLRGGPVVRKA